jgi:hypothetical protein
MWIHTQHSGKYNSTSVHQVPAPPPKKPDQLFPSRIQTPPSAESPQVRTHYSSVPWHSKQLAWPWMPNTAASVHLYHPTYSNFTLSIWCPSHVSPVQDTTHTHTHTHTHLPFPTQVCSHPQTLSNEPPQHNPGFISLKQPEATTYSFTWVPISHHWNVSSYFLTSISAIVPKI